MTLFGEEIVPEQAKPVVKTRAKKTKEEKIPDTEEPKPEIAEEKVSTPEKKEPTEKKEVVPEAIEEEKVEKIKPEKKAPAEKKEKEEKVNLPEDWEGEKQYYTIGEVATLFKVKTSHIRFWTNEFKLKVRTTRKGDRLFSPEQIKELRAIHHLVKERGFTLSGAKAKMKKQNKIDVETIDLKQSLQQLRGKLLIIRNQLT